MRVGIYIYDNAEVLDFSGPYEVFSTASRVSTGTGGIETFLVAEKKQPVIARAAYSVNPHYGFDDHPEIDVLMIPGGVHTAELMKPEVLDWVRKVSGPARIVASVCTGAFILAEAGLLNGRQVTTHWDDVAELRASYKHLTVCESRRWVHDGKYVSSAGISAGIDMSLYLVASLLSRELAEKTARQMDYRWTVDTSLDHYQAQGRGV